MYYIDRVFIATWYTNTIHFPAILANRFHHRFILNFILPISADHLEQPLSMPHEEKRKSSKGFQNGIGPSDPSTQTLVKEVQIFF